MSFFRRNINWQRAKVGNGRHEEDLGKLKNENEDEGQWFILMDKEYQEMATKIKAILPKKR